MGLDARTIEGFPHERGVWNVVGSDAF
jgi:hypothetical protein